MNRTFDDINEAALSGRRHPLMPADQEKQQKSKLRMPNNCKNWVFLKKNWSQLRLNNRLCLIISPKNVPKCDQKINIRVTEFGIFSCSWEPSLFFTDIFQGNSRFPFLIKPNQKQNHFLTYFSQRNLTNLIFIWKKTLFFTDLLQKNSKN